MEGNKQVSSSCEIMLMGASALTGFSIQGYMEDFSVPLAVICSECGNELVCSFLFLFHPPLLGIELWHTPQLLDPVLHIDTSGLHQQYKLHGI